MNNPRIVIIGAGPTGLGAGYRLQELGYDDWTILEAADHVGGLAASFTDEAGFTYDLGGHVMFSHYTYYDDLVDKLLGGDYTELEREAWVWMEDRYLPYPFQTNIRHLEPATVFECLAGLVEAQRQAEPGEPANFREWVDRTMGAGIAKHFMLPYNFKVWATPAELMNAVWIAERVATVDVEAILRNVVLGEDHLSWGPNSTFKYPLRGGTGFLYEGLRPYVQDHLELQAPVRAVDPSERVVTTADGRRFPYDVLLSTMPLNRLVACTEGVPSVVERAAATGLHWSGSHIVGVGVDRPADTTKNWVYYPEPDVPFYRLTYLSNYSPYMTAEPGQTLLLTETSRSPHKPEDAGTIVARTVEGLRRVGVLGDDDPIVTTWLGSPDMSYPVPSTTRDVTLGIVQPWLRSQGIASRGRFGAWLYEIGNMDHSCMQGVEWVDHILFDTPEITWIPRGEEGGDGVR